MIILLSNPNDTQNPYLLLVAKAYLKIGYLLYLFGFIELVKH
jgi:hypothetical protein